MSDTAPRSAGLAARAPNGPLVQSATIGFRLLFIAIGLMALVWLASDIRQVPSDSRAVVTRFGRIVRVQSAGLLIALPRPIESVRLLPGADRQLSHRVSVLPRAAGLDDDFSRATVSPAVGPGESYLTGDGGVVLLDAALTYRITDPVAYAIAEEHVPPALDREFRAAALRVAAAHTLDDFIVIGAGVGAAPGSNGQSEARRLATREALRQALGERLAALTAQGAGLGIEVDRIDLTAALPPAAKLAFDSVLIAGQQADQQLAAARTDAARFRQSADQERDRILAAARATSAERVAAATSTAAPILALAASSTPSTRNRLLDQLWRDRVAAILTVAGRVNAVDGDRVIIPGAKP